MNFIEPGLVVLASAAISTSVATILLIRMLKAATQVGSVAHPMPQFIRLFRIPAELVAPAVLPFLTEKYVQRLDRSLASVELESTLTPASWIGMRLTHATGLALLAAMVTSLARMSVVPMALAGFLVGYSLGGLWMRNTRRSLEYQIARELPSYLDLLTICVEAGATLTAGVNQIIESAPDSPLRRYFEHVLREVRGGQLRTHAFERVAGLYAIPSLSTLAAALGHAESSGMSLGGILRAQGQQRIAERFARAERLAMQAPVKLLGPLVLCIFPCTFVVLAVPIVVRLTEAFGS
jgi:tight adherence protein C